MLFAEVILPISLAKPFTYLVPPSLEDKVVLGQRVSVQFGKRKLYTGLIWRFTEKRPQGYEVKPILDLMDEGSILTKSQMDLWDWISAYYLCSKGQVMQAALPSVFKLQSETIIVRKEGDFEGDNLSDPGFLLMEALSFRDEISIEEAANILDRKRVMPVVMELIEAGIAEMKEEIQDAFRPVTDTFVKMLPKTDEELKEAFEKVGRAKKQSEMLLSLMHQIRQKPNLTKKEWIQVSGGSAAVAKALEGKGIVAFEKRVLDALKSEVQDIGERKLSDVQAKALADVKKGLGTGKPVLLEGVTGSGKTLIYMDLIQEALGREEDVLYLLPEIALTTQIIERLEAIFPGRVVVYHSKFSGNDRGRAWNHLLKPDRQSKLIVGARSAIFPPHRQLGLIVVDEEHDSSYKQYDPAPRYQARDTAIWLAHHLKAKIVLGTATPSLESYFNALSGKYAYVKITERYGGASLPEIQLIDLKEAHKRKQMKGMFSPDLLMALRENHAAGKQAILFQNRRGFSPMLECQTCGTVSQCRNCDISLTYHKGFDLLRCHYCGYQEPLPQKCRACDGHELSTKGYGTEQILEELNFLEPDWKLERMDLDTTRGKKSHAQILHRFQEKQIDVLIGTQMVTKGLDFDDVGLVGVLNADNMLKFPDFRAFERGFQLLMQVAGRAGRKSDPGEVLIQTFEPQHRILTDVRGYKQKDTYEFLMNDRRKFGYPPFLRLVSITLKHRTPETVNRASEQLAAILRERLGHRVLGPAIPGAYRLRNLFQKQILIKISKNQDLNLEKRFILDSCKRLDHVPEYRSIRLGIDVDPY